MTPLLNRLSLGSAIPGHWCEHCAAPSVDQYPIWLLTDIGLFHVADYYHCADCCDDRLVDPAGCQQ